MMKKIIAIIGGGPAGLSCALWLKGYGLSPVIIEKVKQLGGALNNNPSHSPHYLGMPNKTGVELAQACREHIEISTIPTLLEAKLTGIRHQENEFKIYAEENEISAQAIVIATGLRAKRDKNLESVLAHHSLSTHLCFNAGMTMPIHYGPVVAIIGGGDNALWTALNLVDRAKQVHLFIRSELRGFKLNQKRIFEFVESGQIILHQPVTIQKFEHQKGRVAIIFQEENQPQQIVLPDAIYFRIGFTPNTEEMVQLFNTGEVGNIELDAAGYIITDRFMRTTIPCVYAAGDVASPRDSCVATAVAHGAIVARSIEEDL
jgi:thioredoxin reductase (NADPH)